MHQLTQRPDASGSQSSSRCAMRACESSQFFSSLIALLAPLVGGVGYTTAPNTEGIVDKPATRVVFPDEITQQPRSRALEEVDTGPDPFFADLVDRTPFVDPDLDEGTAVANKEPPRTYYVEVYENEYRGLGWRWRELRHGRSLANLRWSYKDGSAALPPVEVLPPDDWEWVCEWKIDGSGGRDTGGWEYTKEIGKFDASRVPRGKKRADRFRRRRWVRSMRPQLEKQRKDLNEAGLQLESLSEAMGMGSPALHMHAYEYEAEDFGLELGRDVDVGLLPAPDLHDLQDGYGRTSSNLPALGSAVKALKAWWTEEFTFRGFGIGFVKPIFRGMLIRPDIGVGIRLPLTLHFRSWERQEALPSVSASFFVLWPPAVQVSQAMSYPAELLQEWATTAARKIAVPSKEALQARERKEAVQRLGVSMGVRYSATYGFQWWLAPYFFLLPGVRVIWHLYQSMMTMLLSSMALMQRSDVSELWEGKDGKDERQQAIWLLALRSWADAKTSGLGYSLNYSGSRLGGAVMVNFMPFFLPTFATKLLTSDGDENTAVEEALVEKEVFESPTTTMSEVEDRLLIENVSDPRVTDVVERDIKLGATGAGRHNDAELQPCAA